MRIVVAMLAIFTTTVVLGQRSVRDVKREIRKITTVEQAQTYLKQTGVRGKVWIAKDTVPNGKPFAYREGKVIKHREKRIIYSHGSNSGPHTSFMKILSVGDSAGFRRVALVYVSVLKK